MNINHIRGVILRNILLWFRDLDKIFDAFWWAFFDVLVWGFMSSYYGKTSGDHTLALVITGVIFWGILSRSQWELSSIMLIESWDKNLINMYIAPLKTSEFLFASVILGLLKAIMVMGFLIGITFLIYQFNVFSLSWWIIPLFANVFLTSIWLAFCINAFILRFGKSIMTFAWTLVYLLNPISGVVYPLSALPPIVQTVARLIPSYYVFEGMRSVLLTGSMDPKLLVTSFGLNMVYLVLSIIFYLVTFKKAREQGWLIKLA